MEVLDVSECCQSAVVSNKLELKMVGGNTWELLGPGSFTIGRVNKSESCGLKGDRIGVMDAQVSRKHARIECSDELMWTIQDLKSLNESFLNDSELEPYKPSRPLCFNDQVRVGRTTFVIQKDGGQARGSSNSDKENTPREETPQCVSPKTVEKPKGQEICTICGKSLENMLVLDREIHVNNCLDTAHSESVARKIVLDGGEGVSSTQVECIDVMENSQDVGRCCVCAVNLSLFSLEERIMHTNNCLDSELCASRKKKKNPTQHVKAKVQKVISSTILDSDSDDFQTERRSTKKRSKEVSKSPKISETGIRAPNYSQRKITGLPVATSIHNAQKRIKLIDTRIEELKYYRNVMTDYLERAESLRDHAASSTNVPNANTSQICDTMFNSSSSSFSLSSVSDGNAVENDYKPGPLQHKSKATPPESTAPNKTVEDLCEDLSSSSQEEPATRPFTSTLIKSVQKTIVQGDQSAINEGRNCLDTKKPMPRYCEMSDQQLKGFMAEYGMEIGPKSYMITELERLWKIMNPESAESMTANLDPDLSRSNPAQAQEQLSLAICTAITKTLQNETLYENILMNKSIDLVTVQSALDREGVKVPLKYLARFLDSHGITYRQANTSRRRKGN